MKIVVLVEGKTEQAFKAHLLSYLHKRLRGSMPKLDFHPYNGRIPTHDKLKRIVDNHLISLHHIALQRFLSSENAVIAT